MHLINRRLAILGASALLSSTIVAGCTTQPPWASDAYETVTVTALYRERILLPPGHTLIVQVDDVSLADVPSITLVEVRQSIDGRSPPYTVTLQVPKRKLVANHDYAASAYIRSPDGALRFATDTRHSVLTRGAGNSAEITMIGVP